LLTPLSPCSWNAGAGAQAVSLGTDAREEFDAMLSL
jgi:hypothetical protein